MPARWYPAPAVIAALLPLAAAMIVTMPGFRFRRPGKARPASQRSVDIFLNRLMHETWYNETRFVTFRVDCFLFDFRRHNPDGLEKQVQYQFFEYLRTLDMSQQQAIVKAYIWLMQHGVKFDFRYQYNKSLPFRYNWAQRKKPAKLKSLLESVDRDDLLSYDLSKDPHALRKP